MYYEYWGLKKHAFHNVPDPTMYFDMHESVESAVSEVLFAIEEGDECLAVIVGEVGLGKTMSLRMILDNLDEKKFRPVLITNPALTFPQLLREIIGQLSNTPCEIQSKDRLMEEFHQLLVKANRKAKKTVILTDEANAITRTNLESMRLLTNLQADDHNLFTLVLAGQPQLAEQLERPEMANLYQRIGIYARLSKLGSREIVKDYIEHRIERAGRTKRIFTEDAIDMIWHYSEEGVPRLVNRICKLALKAGETNNLKSLDATIIEGIGQRFEKRGPNFGKIRQEVKEKPRQAQATKQQVKLESVSDLEDLILLEDSTEETPETKPRPAANESPAAVKTPETDTTAHEPDIDQSRHTRPVHNSEPGAERLLVKEPPPVEERKEPVKPAFKEGQSEPGESRGLESKPANKERESKPETRQPVTTEIKPVDNDSPEPPQTTNPSQSTQYRERATQPAPNSPSPREVMPKRPEVSKAVPTTPINPVRAVNKPKQTLTPAQNSGANDILAKESLPKVELDPAQISNADREKLWDMISDVLRTEAGEQVEGAKRETDEKIADTGNDEQDGQLEWQGMKGDEIQKLPLKMESLPGQGSGEQNLLPSREMTDEDARIEEEHNKEIIVGMRERFRRPQSIGY